MANEIKLMTEAVQFGLCYFYINKEGGQSNG